jgi:aspartate/methionine/tyrosine aminotransferase
MISESIIRRMTRLAYEYDAINLSQGYPNESPPHAVRAALAYAVLTGDDTLIVDNCESDPQEIGKESLPKNDSESLSDSQNKNGSIWKKTLGELMLMDPTRADISNQYSPPMGRPDLHDAVRSYYKLLYNFDTIEASLDVTITLGATEAVASALRTIGSPGDKVVIFEPFHELYPNQCGIFYLDPIFVSLREVFNSDTKEFDESNTSPKSSSAHWTYDRNELRNALSQAKILLLNTPHNPTGKVFRYEELTEIVNWCIEFDVSIITDEIYEHMVHPDNLKHYVLPHEFPQIRDRVYVCNSIGKAVSATGWRVGWCLHPRTATPRYRAVHDQMVVMSPHPMQLAARTYLSLPRDYFVVQVRRRYQRRIQILRDALQSVGFRVSNPEGAYYLLADYSNVPLWKNTTNSEQNNDGIVVNPPTPEEAALYMLQHVGVACVPADAFTSRPNPGYYLRFAACRSEEDITAASQRLIEKLGKVTEISRQH